MPFKPSKFAKSALWIAALRQNSSVGDFGSAPASGAVRCALAPNLQTGPRLASGCFQVGREGALHRRQPYDFILPRVGQSIAVNLPEVEPRFKSHPPQSPNLTECLSDGITIR
jgi:hypothetical protein